MELKEWLPVAALIGVLALIKLVDWLRTPKPVLEPPEGFELGINERVWALEYGMVKKAIVVGYMQDRYVVRLDKFGWTEMRAKSQVSKRVTP